jgi:hypothetical protein
MARVIVVGGVPERQKYPRATPENITARDWRDDAIFQINGLFQSTSLFSENDSRINIHRKAHWLPNCYDADGSDRQ